MISVITFFHAIFCILLMIVILMQSGRGGGLTEQFSSAESMFGTKTNEFMVRTTSVLAALFLVSSILLAYFSAKKDQSLIPERIINQKPLETITIPIGNEAAVPAPATTNP